MATTFINSATYDSASSATATVNKPTNTADGDIMFALITVYNDTTDPNTVPAGWTLLYTNKATHHWRLYWKIASSEGANYAWGWAASKQVKATISTYRRSDITSSNPIQVSSNTAYTTSDTTVRAASINTTCPTTLLFIAGVQDPSAYSFAPPTNPGNFTENYDNHSTTSDWAHTFAIYEWSSAGATGNIDATFGEARGSQKHAFAVALNFANSFFLMF